MGNMLFMVACGGSESLISALPCGSVGHSHVDVMLFLVACWGNDTVIALQATTEPTSTLVVTVRLPSSTWSQPPAAQSAAQSATSKPTAATKVFAMLHAEPCLSGPPLHETGLLQKMLSDAHVTVGKVCTAAVSKSKLSSSVNLQC